jgi:type II secretory pathway pseudopilin PulG
MAMRSIGDEGYSLGNVIATLVICIVLACVILPALQPNRTGGGRRSECLNNMRNIGVAMHNYEAAHGRLPPSGVWDVTDPAAYAEWSDLGNIANNKSNQATMRYSWALLLMPYLDHSDIYDAWDFSESKTPAQPIGADAKGKSGFGSYWMTATPKSANGGNAQLANTSIKVITCPSDPTSIPGKGNLSYVVNGGFSYHWRMDHTATGGDGRGTLIDLSKEQNRRWSENVRNSGVFFLESSKAYADSFTPPLKTDDRRSLKLDEIKDGLASTVMMSENINAGASAVWETGGLKSNWACPHPWNTSFFVNSVTPPLTTAGDHFRFKSANMRGKEAPPLKPFGSQGGINGDLSGEFEGQFPYANSGHKDVVHLLFCDGSAKPISQTADPEVWAAMVTPNGKKFVDPATGKAIIEPSPEQKYDD